MISGAVVNVLDFGADPSGLTECSANIQAAIDSLHSTAVGRKGGTVFFPTGTYLISSPLTIVPGITGNATTTSLVGEDRSSTTIKWSGVSAPANGMIVCTDYSIYANGGAVWQNFALNGNNVATREIGRAHV